jgi:hypothetical protein
MERWSRMSEWLRGRSRSSAVEEQSAPAVAELLASAAAASFPVAPAAHLSGFGCSCDRIGCPTPAVHPVSFAWQTQATTDPEQIARWLRSDPRANFITATGVNHDVLDVPVAAGLIALERLAAEGHTAPGQPGQPAPPAVGPVASCGPDRLLFFTTTRGTPEDEDEWWPCELDCHPETLDDHPGLRWHCRGSYVLLPPSRLPDGSVVTWVRPPELPLPDALPLLEVLTEACAKAADAEGEQPAPLPYG